MKKIIKVTLLSMLVTYSLLNASLYNHSLASQSHDETAVSQRQPIVVFEAPDMPQKPWELTVDHDLVHPGEDATREQLLDYHHQMAYLLQLQKDYERKMSQYKDELLRREVAYQKQFEGLPRGADMPVDDPFGEREVTYSSFADQSDIVNRLLQKDREEEALLMLQRGHKPKKSSLYVAAKLGYENTIPRLLVDNNGEPRKYMDVNHLEEGETALHAAVLGKHHGVIEKLKDFGVDPNIRNQKGLTPLELAASETFVDAETLRTLRDTFHDSIGSDQYKKAHEYALQQDNAEKLEVLLPHIGMNSFELAAMSGGAQSIKHLLDNPEEGMSVTPTLINELLRLATEHQNKSVVHVLLDEYNANPYDKVGPDKKSAWDVASGEMSGIFCQKYFNSTVCAVSGSLRSGRNYVGDVMQEVPKSARRIADRISRPLRSGRNYVHHVMQEVPQSARRVVADAGQYLQDVGLTPRPQRSQQYPQLGPSIGFSEEPFERNLRFFDRDTSARLRNARRAM